MQPDGLVEAGDVVGDVDHRSPEVSTRVQSVNINPTWTVPQSIIKNEIIPKMRRDPGYLTRAKIRILDKDAPLRPGMSAFVTIATK